MPDVESRRAFLDEVRVLALTDPIPNDLCAVRKGFPEAMWDRFEASFRSTFGVTTGQFEEDWKEYVKDRYGWLFVLSHSAIFWLVLTLGSVLLWRIRRHRNRLKMARLRAREIPERPAYWLVGGTAGGPAPGASRVLPHHGPRSRPNERLH